MTKIDTRLDRLYTTGQPQFQRDMGTLLGPPIVDGNRFRVLLNGDRIFPAMLDAIRGARETITFETYIYWSGQIGREFTDPAIMTGGAASRASDIWSLGACLHYALTGHGVYGDLRSTEPLLLVRSILASQPTISDQLPASARELVEASLATDVATRPRTADEVADRISGIVAELGTTV